MQEYSFSNKFIKKKKLITNHIRLAKVLKICKHNGTYSYLLTIYLNERIVCSILKKITKKKTHYSSKITLKQVIFKSLHINVYWVMIFPFISVTKQNAISFNKNNH